MHAQRRKASEQDRSSIMEKEMGKKKRTCTKKKKKKTKTERVTCSVGNLNVKAKEQNTGKDTAFSVNGRTVRLEGVQVILLTIPFPQSI